MNPFTAYDKPIDKCENHKYSGTLALSNEVQRRYPALRHNGTYSCRPVAGTGTPSAHMQDQGVDKSQDNANAKAQAEAAFWWLIANAEKVGLQGVIFDHKIWGFGKRYVRETHPDGNPHTDHVHFEVNLAGAKLSAAELANRLRPPPNQEEEEDMAYAITYKDGDGNPTNAVWITDGIYKWGLPSPEMLKQLQAAHIVKDVITLSQDTVQNIKDRP